MKNKIFLYRLLIAFLLIIISAYTFQRPVRAADSTGPTDKAELERFMDSTIMEVMNKYNLPGAVFSVVKDGKVFLEKGYGYSNVEKKIPVSPESTIFRIGSVSKLFTSTAVMQLKEQGRIEINKDVNDYLKVFKIENKYSKPVTMYNLLTHTAGFDDRWTGAAAPDYTKVMSLGEYLSKNMPEIIREPGNVTQYSNHGMTLAGHIVEEVSGMPFDEYIIGNITKPLGMNNTYPRIMQGMVNNLALEYVYKNGSYKPMQLYDFNIYPAGSVCSTSSDMAKFMIAHLNNGSLGESRILKDETAKDMHSQHFTNSPKVPGMCYGFYEIMEGTHRFIAHGGDTNGTHSFLFLDPAQNIGLFISNNGVQGQFLTSELVQKFIKHYYSMAEVPAIAEAHNDGLEKNIELEGEYRSIRFARNTLDKLVLLLTPQTKIRMEGDILIFQSPELQARCVQVEPLLFKNMENGRYLSFRTNSSGDVTYMFTEIPTFAFEKVRWYESNSLHMILLGGFILIFLSWCVYYCIHSLRNMKKKERTRGRFAGRLLTLISISNVVFLVGIAVTVLSMDSVSDIGFKLPLVMKILLVGQIPVAVLTGVLAAATFIVWRKGYWKVPGRICFTMVVASNICFTALMYYYNIIGIRY